jgi:hypothetical protein
MKIVEALGFHGNVAYTVTVLMNILCEEKFSEEKLF